ncbi:MAG: diguanylate cyclase [Oscillospiraceae bacterium]
MAAVTFIHIITIASTVMAAAILIFSLHLRAGIRSNYFVYLALCTTLYLLGFVFETTAHTAEGAFRGVLLEYMGLSFLPALLFLFVCDYCGRQTTLPGRVCLMLPGAGALLLVITSPWQGLFIQEGQMEIGRWASRYRIVPGPLYLAFFAFVYLLLAVSMVLLARCIAANKKERVKSFLVLLAILLPSASGAVYLAGVTFYGADATPWVFNITLLLIGFSIFRLNLLEVLPVARDKMLEELGDAYVLVDDHQRYLAGNKAAKRLFPALRQERMGTPLAGIEGIKDYPLGSAPTGTELAVQGPQGLRYYRVSRTRVYQKRERAVTSVILYDVTENKHLVEDLNKMAAYDSLTQIYNRGTFFKLAQQRYKEAALQGQSAAVLMIDIDHFKNVNDFYGHRCGDEVLATVARRLSGRFREGDVFGRYGGEEFCVFLPGLREENAAAVGEDVRSIIAGEPFVCDGGAALAVTVSVGTAVYNANRHSSLEALLSAADNALYRAKQNGRNRVEAWDEPVTFDSCRIY